MFKRRTETRNVRIAEAVTCNKCGRSCELDDDGPDSFPTVELKKMWDDDSPKEGEAHLAHLCEGCYDALVATFLIPPEIRKFCPPDPHDPFDPEIERLMEK